jgi:NTP pyrophosphatase (non-canonical NTP hydrolase)
MNNLNELSKQLHERSKEKGFWDEPSEVGTHLMLIVSELSEALEADRKSKHAELETFELTQFINKENHTIKTDEFDALSFQNLIKDTFEDEIADAFIRLFDLVGAYNIDIEKHIELKMQYNKTRPYKHEKAY